MKQQFIFSSTTKNPTLTEQKSNEIKSSFDINGLFKTFANPEGLTMIGILVFLILLSQFSGGKKGKISTGRVVGRGEKLAATNLALKQIRDRIRHLADKVHSNYEPTHAAVLEVLGKVNDPSNLTSRQERILAFLEQEYLIN
jgi:hypothetical protein